jgi:hypothetical protein
MSLTKLTREEAFLLEHWPNGVERLSRQADFADKVTGDLIEVKQGDLTSGQLSAFLGSFNSGGHPKLALVRRELILVFELVKVVSP